ncbi:hypothetical protein PMAYCL1PPCAC_24113 [Pristionchus mayeri]|uniref:Uncharacterized protein n=1 Tax=Pristionchus mayeri TaxID=1317129 RepID=A0AAN5CZW6_9BILA|nr:hypothetical protein PMAYCL1PPCAC_24113 [Pristionchus mayeri]
MCDGEMAQCPNATSANEILPCMDAVGVCYKGTCNLTRMCIAKEMEECESPEKTCMRHCKTKDGVCKSTADLDQFKHENYTQKGRWGHPGVMLRPMSQCMAGKGQCDQFDMCKPIKVSGSLSRNFEKFKSFGQTIVNKIWILIIIVIVVIALLVVVIKFCSYATPSSNPKKPKAKSLKQIKNMMSDRVKRMSSKRKPRKGKVNAPVEKKEKTNDEED